MSAPNTPVRRIKPVYAPLADGDILLYAGDLVVSAEDGSTRTVPGDINLRLQERTKVWASFAGDDPWLLGTFPDTDKLEVTLPPGAPLDPPQGSAVLVRPEQAKGWITGIPRINHLAVGDIGLAERLVIHVTGSLGVSLQWPEVETDEGGQDQLSLTLPGWTLRMAAMEQEDETPFSYVIEAIPSSAAPTTEEQLHELTGRVFTLLSFARGTAIGIFPAVGLDAAGSVVRAEWAAPRVGSTYSRQRWCWDGLVETAVPALFAGIASLGTHQGLERCVERAMRLCLAANDGEVELDVKIPLACSGLELVAWSVLQHHAWLTPGAGLKAGQRLRLLLQWAGIPVDIPAGLTHLVARKLAFLGADEGGPEIVFEVRNRLVHPPKNLRDPEWPKSDVLLDAWQLAMWYLELAILRVLGYDGEYVSRLIQTGWVGTTEPVPWT